MTFYQRFGLAIGLAGIAVVADTQWIGYLLVAVAFLFLVFDGDTPGKVGSKWYGVTHLGLTGPFSKANEAAAGPYGAKPDAVIQVFGTGGWAEKVGVILHPITPEPAIPDYISLAKQQWYVADSDLDDVWAGPFESESDAVANLDPDCTDYARLFRLYVPASLAGHRFEIDYYEESPAADEDGKMYWVSAEPFDPES